MTETPDSGAPSAGSEAERARIVRAFERRFWLRNLVILPLLAAAWVGRGVAATEGRHDDAAFVWSLAGAVVLVGLALAVAVAVWRCPRCGGRIWGEWKPARCAHCGAPFVR